MKQEQIQNVHESKYCQCGCGSELKPYPCTCKKYKHFVNGKIYEYKHKQPFPKYINGHRSRKQYPSEEVRNKISIANKGKLRSDENKEKLSLAWDYNKHFTEDIKKKLREARAKRILPVKDTLIEIKIQNFLKQLNIEFFTHQYIHIEHGYQCDIFIPVQKEIIQKTIIECDGDYWHGNLKLYKEEKLIERQKKQRENDKLRTEELQKIGFRVIRLWEHKINQMNLEDLKNIIR